MPTGTDLALHFFLQLAIVLGACRLLGYLFRRVRQPFVVAEMVVGIVLGPSLLGLIAPAGESWLFPHTITLSTGSAAVTVTHPSLAVLYVVGQLGLVLYMFLVGLEFDTSVIREHRARAGGISISSIASPLLLGGLLGYLLSDDQRFFPHGVAPWQAALFLGCALMVTAFPVLARIIDDLDIGRTQVAALALGAAATCDAAAWTLLALIVAGANRSPLIAAAAVGGGALYLAVMVVIGRPVLQRYLSNTERADGVRGDALAVTLILLMLCAWFTDAVGVYSVFGAFVLGAVLPRGRFTTDCRQLLEGPVVVLLLPIYFVYSGLNTRIGLLNGAGELGVAVAIVVVAVIAKGGGSMLAARLAGSTWRQAASLGALMNARGLMELVLANIGLQRGLITPSLFTILVLLTIATTLAASPMFQLFQRPLRGQVEMRQVERDSIPAR